MTQTDVLALGDGFSWRRVAMLWRYVYPGLRWQVIWYPVVALFCSAVYVMAMFVGTTSYNIAASMGMVLTMMTYLAPLSLAGRDFRSTIGLLPVMASEKLVFLLLYFCGYILLVTSGISVLATYMSRWLFPEVQENVMYILSSFKGLASPITLLGCTIMSMALILCTLYGVLSARTNRIGKGILFAVIGFVVYCLVSVAGAVGYGIRYIKGHSKEYLEERMRAIGEEVVNKDIDPEQFELQDLSPQAFDMVVDMMREVVEPLYGVLAIVSLLVGMSLAWVIYRKMKKGGF